ncbi:hypothetical protein C5167_039470 [Papaver somniferum]|uniref:Reverse transcriptase Ty1/copia-type domain-containing protein n=1 Tax=Papaver somniferum TaxID=3469 RepID=A0A4Y7IC79_PAPSO|nr:hypothetical protein C5167_039470 [Papaver somniferum]
MMFIMQRRRTTQGTGGTSSTKRMIRDKYAYCQKFTSREFLLEFVNQKQAQSGYYSMRTRFHLTVNIECFVTKVTSIANPDEFGTIVRNKAKLVAQGCSQIEGIDFDETFAPVARLESIRLLLAHACFLKVKLFQMDIKSAFLNGNLKEEVYVAQPKGLEILISQIMKGFSRGGADKTLFTKWSGKDVVIAQVYVDDIIYGSTSEKLAKDFQVSLGKEFEMSNAGELKFGLDKSTPKLKPMPTTATRPDIAFSMGCGARFQGKPKESHLVAAKRIIRYVNHMVGMCGRQKKYIRGFYYVVLNLVASHRKKQNSQSLSTCEAEYIAAGSCCTQLLWMKQMLVDYGIDTGIMKIFCDNSSAIRITKNPVEHSRTKHIDIRMTGAKSAYLYAYCRKFTSREFMLEFVNQKQAQSGYLSMRARGVVDNCIQNGSMELRGITP